MRYYSVYLNVLIQLSVDQHENIDKKTEHDRVEHESTGAFRLKDRTRDGVDLGGSNDKKEKSRLHAVKNTRVHVYIVSIYFYVLDVHFIDMKRNKDKRITP